jgi:hypothetical protein
MLPAVRDLQVPLLAVLLLGGCASKGWRVVRARSLAPAMGPAGLFPWRLRRPIMIGMCVAEFGLGLALLATAGPAFGSVAATLTRAGTALFFLIAMGTLYEVRLHRPEAGCGCFGEFSETPVGLRTIGRAGLLCIAAATAIGAPPLHLPASSGQAAALLGVLAAELALIAALSPEVGEIMVRLGYSEPCELRRLPVTRTLAALRASTPWRRYAGQLASFTPVDVWREGCWRFVVFPGLVAGRRVEVVYAVYLQARRPPIRVAVLDDPAAELSPADSAAL